MMTVALTDLVVRRGDALAAPVEDGVVLLDPDSQNYVGFDRIGTAIWERIETATPVSALCTALAAQFDGDRDRIEADTLRFLDRIIDLGLARKG